MRLNSYPYANGRLSVISQKMLDRGRFSRLAESDGKEAVRILREAGYGAGAGDSEDVGRLIEAELSEARALVMELAPDPEIISLFLLQTDAHNLKVFLKAKLLNVSAEGIVPEGGAFPAALFQKAVEEGETEGLPEPFVKAIHKAEEIAGKTQSSKLVSAAADRAVFEYAAEVLKKHPNDFAKRYFSALADYTNVGSLIRARKLGWSPDELAPMLVPGGSIAQSTIVGCAEMSPEQLGKALSAGNSDPSIGRAAEESALAGSPEAMDKSRDAALMGMAREGKGDIFGLGPLVGYLLGREAEARAIRMIFAAKGAGASAALPELYV